MKKSICNKILIGPPGCRGIRGCEGPDGRSGPIGATGPTGATGQGPAEIFQGGPGFYPILIPEGSQYAIISAVAGGGAGGGDPEEGAGGGAGAGISNFILPLVNFVNQTMYFSIGSGGASPLDSNQGGSGYPTCITGPIDIILSGGTGGFGNGGTGGSSGFGQIGIYQVQPALGGQPNGNSGYNSNYYGTVLFSGGGGGAGPGNSDEVRYGGTGGSCLYPGGVEIQYVAGNGGASIFAAGASSGYNGSGTPGIYGSGGAGASLQGINRTTGGDGYYIIIIN